VTNARIFRKLIGLFALAIVTALSGWAQSAAPQRVTQRIDESQLKTIPGHVRPFLQAGVDHGPVDGGERIGVIMLMFARTPEQQQDLDALVDELHNVRSPNYHKWLTPEQFGERFEPADEDVLAVKAWLESKGLRVLDVVPSRTHIAFTGTVGQLQDAFHVQIHHITLNGESHEATIDEPQVPAALAPVIGGLHKLDNFSPKPLFSMVGAFTKDLKTGVSTPVPGTVASPRVPAFTNGNSADAYYELAPHDFYTVYNESPLLNAGITGAGQTIAVIEEAQVAAADVDAFRTQFGLTPYPKTPSPEQGGVNYLYGSGSGLNGYASCSAPASQALGKSSGEESEADIDLQWAGAVAPNATVDLVACGSASDGESAAIGSLGIDHSAQYIVNFLSGDVVAASMSYGECESDMTGAAGIGVGYYNAQWEQFAAEGITAVVSAGDNGSQRCYQLNKAAAPQFLPVNGLGSSAYNVSAGGTEFADTYISNNYTMSPSSTWWNPTDTTRHSTAVAYVPETALSGYCSNALFASYLRNAGSNASPDALCKSSAAGSKGGTQAAVSGGNSAYTFIPTWQSVYGVGIKPNASPLRNLPDISMFASSGLWGHFLPYCQSDLYPCTHTNAMSASGLGAGGTSFVAPQFAGLIALVSQKTNSRQGQAAYTIYDLAAHEFGTVASPKPSQVAACSASGQSAGIENSCIFHDVSDDLPSLQGGFAVTQSNQRGVSALAAKSGEKLANGATPGYDNATGLGSFNIANLIERWNAPTAPFASKTALKSSVDKILPTSAATLTATVAATGRGGMAVPAGKAQFFLDSTSGTFLGSSSIVSNCSGSGPNAMCSGVATLTLPGKALNPGSNNVIAYFPGDGANDDSSTSDTVHVDLASTQTISFTAPTTVVYGASPITLSATATSGLPVTFSLVSGPATLTGNALNFTGAGSVLVQADQAGNGIYGAADPVQQTILVTPAPLSISVASASVPYGTALPTFTSTLTGLVNGDETADAHASVHSLAARPALKGTVDGGGIDLIVTYSTTANASAPYSNVGTYPIKATLSGAAAGNYTITTNTPGTLTINKVALTVTSADASGPYGSALPTLTGTVTGTVNGDTVGTTLAVSYSTTASSTAPFSNAGTYPITASVSGASAANYTVTNTPATLTINKVSLSITVANASGAYGSALPAFTSTINGLVNGDASADAFGSVHSLAIHRAVKGTVDGGAADLTVTYSTTANSTAPYSNAGTYPITATLSGAAAGNYTVSSNTPGTLTINKAGLTVTVANASGAYGSALPTLTGSVTGTVNGDTVGTTLAVSYSTTASSTAPYSNAGAYPITASVSGASAGNYTLTNTPGTLTINKAGLTVTVANASGPYGSALPTFTSTINGLVNGDASADAIGSVHSLAIHRAVKGTVDGGAADLTVTYSTTANSTAPYSNAGTYPITATLSGQAAGNYTISSNTPGTLTINKAALTVTVANASGPYGSALPTLTGSVTGTVNGDSLGTTLAVSYATTAKSSSPYSNAGTYPITASVSGASAGNYTVTNTPGTLTINKAGLTVTVANASGSYGSALPTLTGSVTGTVNGDAVGTTLTVSYSTTASSSAPYSNAGTYPITATLGGSSLSNYTLTNTPGTLTINKAGLTITVANASGPYGSALPTFTSTLGGLVNGDASADARGSIHSLAVHRAVQGSVDGSGDLTVIYATTANSTAPYSNAGTYPITATLSGAAAGNYTISSNSPGTLTINKAALTVTVANASGPYGSALPTLTGSVTGTVNGDTVGTTLSVSYATTAKSSSPYSNAGTYPITASVSGASAGNYTVTNTPATLTINKAGLTVTVANASGSYGSALPTLTGTVTGTVNGDTVGTTLAVSYSTTASSTAPYSNAGTYPITASVSGASAGNYTLTNTPGTLTINKAGLTVTVANASGPYGSALPTLTGSVTGTVNGDTVGTTLSVSYATTAKSSSPYSNAGTYPITATLGGSSLGNYTISSNTPGTLTITKAGLTVTVANASGPYGSALPTLTGSVTGTVNGDTVGTTLTVSYATTAKSSSPYSNAGTYPITATLGGSSLGNYTISSNTPGTLTITKAGLTVTVANASGSYGSALPTLTGSVTGTVNGDTVGTTLTVSYVTTAKSSSPYSNAGTYPITATLGGSSLSNYTISSNTPGTLTINKAGLTVTVANASGSYGSALPTLTGSVTGTVNGDTVGTTLTVSYATTAKSSSPYSNAGTYPITATLGGSSLGNYTISSNTPGTLTINKAPLSVKANNATRAFGLPNPAFSAAITGFVNGDAQSVVSGAPSLTTAATSASPVGNYPITPTLGSLQALNYSFNFATGTLTITQATPAIVWATPAAITYGTALSSTQLNATSKVPGTLTYTPVSGTVLTAGSQTLSVKLTPTDSTDYTTATATVTLTVNKATPAIVWATPVAITYGTALSSTQLNATSKVPGTLTYTPVSGTVLTAGSQTLSVKLTPTDSTDYTTATATVTLTVNKATPAIVWAPPAAITYGTALSSTQLNATSKVPGTLTYTPVSGTVLTAGSQTLSVKLTPTDSTDYTTATATVTLTVNKATPAIVWAPPAAITYGTALSSTQLNATSKVPGTFTYTPAAGTVLTVGSHTLSVKLTPTDSTDYTTATATVSLTVNPAPSFTLGASPTSLTIARGASGKSTITVTSHNGFTGNVTLAASGLPSGVTAAFATNPTTGTSVLTLKASSTATIGAAVVTVKGTSGSLSASTTIALTVTK